LVRVVKVLVPLGTSCHLDCPRPSYNIVEEVLIYLEMCAVTIKIT
jgi:hypothetical protein